MLSVRILAAAAGLVPIAAAPALGAWSGPEQASRGPLPARSPVVAANARGDVAAAWVRGARRDAAIVVSVRPAGGAWGAPVAISRRGRPAIDPVVVVDADGDVVVAWRQVVRTRTVPTRAGRRRQAVYVVRTRERAVDGTRWSRITTLSSARQKVGPPELATSDAGIAIATWHWGTGTSPRDRGYVGEVQFAERRTNGSWSGPRRLSRSPLCDQVRLPRVAAGARGHAVIWWQCDLSAGRSTALAVTRPPDADFGPELELPFRTTGDVSADVAVGGDGRALAVSADSSGTLEWSRGPVGTTTALGALPVLGKGARVAPDAEPPSAAVDAEGDALTAWVDIAGRPTAAPVASDLGVGVATALAPAGDAASSIRVAVGNGPTGVAGWIAGGRAMASLRAPDGSMSAGETLSGRGVDALDPPAVAMDAAGGATMLWTRVVRGRPVVERASGAAG